MKVLVVDSISPKTLGELEKAGCKLVVDTKMDAGAMKTKVSAEKPEIILVRSKKIPAEVLKAGLPELKGVIRAGSGVDNIDIKTATENSIQVANCPGMNSVAVAELVFTHLLSIDRHIVEADNGLKSGNWIKGQLAGKGVKGQTIGIVGYGFIGREIAKRALAFDMKVLAYDPFVIPEPVMATRVKTIEELLKQSDIVSLHVPKTPKTVGMVNKEFLGLMKKDAVLINTSRGDLVNEDDLLEHLNANPEFRVGLDVFKGEPTLGKAPFSSKLAGHKSVNGTPHIGASTKQAEFAIGELAGQMVIKFMKTKTLDNCVNIKKPKL